MHSTLKLAVLGALLSTGVAAVDIQYCHGGTVGACGAITFATPATTCYALSATVGTVDTIVGLTAGVKYTVFTGAGCTGTASTVFSAGSNTLVAPFLGKVLSLSAGVPTVWATQGCFTDFAGSRTLAASTLVNSTMTIEKCQAFCDAGGFGFAGVEFGSECYCDYSIQFPAALSNDTTCNVPCGGNVNQTCGGASRINVFYNGKPLPTFPVNVTSGVSTWSYSGCFVDNIVTRSIPIHLEPTTGGVTPQTCIATCLANKFSVAGVENGNECWCGNAVNTNAAKVTDPECGTACTVNPTLFCGDALRLGVWSRKT